MNSVEHSPILSLEDITKYYSYDQKKNYVLKDVSIDFNQNSWYIITGESGCGKSSLLNVISGLDKVQKGTVKFHCQKNSWDFIRSYVIGIVFQSFNLLNEFTVLENVMLPKLFQKGSKKSIKMRAMDYLEKFGLQNNIKQKPNTLSGGEQQRVAIARSLINNPQIIIADEPTGNLDRNNTQIIMDIFQELITKENKTIIMVSHDPSLFSYANEIITIKDASLHRQNSNKEPQ